MLLISIVTQALRNIHQSAECRYRRASYEPHVHFDEKRLENRERRREEIAAFIRHAAP